MVSFFECFEPEIYYTLLATLLITSLTISVIKRRIQDFFSYIWIFTSVLLSNSHSIKRKSLSDRVLTGVWLMSCIVLLAAFSGLLRDQLLRPDPIYWIDSFQDLYEWKGQIQTSKGGYFNTFIQNNLNDPMANNFRNRLNVTAGLVNKDDSAIDYRGICEGRTAVVTVLQWLQMMKVKLTDCREDIDYHISRMEEISQPMFF